MEDSEEYIRSLLIGKDSVSGDREKLLTEFLCNPANKETTSALLENKKQLMDKWAIKNRIYDLMQQQVTLPNATVNKPYEIKLDFDSLNWNDLALCGFKDLTEYGLAYDESTQVISGIPIMSGDFKLNLKFRLKAEDALQDAHIKTISIIINPDSKSLWKNLESNKNDPYWKEDVVKATGQLGDKNIVVVSKRGRSHANQGSFRDDDFAFAHLEDSGWSIVVMSDGAGSAKISRKGSELACQTVISYFKNYLKGDVLREVDGLVKKNHDLAGESQKELNLFIYNNFGKAALSVHKTLEHFAAEQAAELRDLHCTLIFTLFKKYEFGYALFSFGVGDCPIGVLNKEQTEISLLNWLDVGEYGGGTRFITMPEIFSSNKFASRFHYKLMDDFSYLFLMTDGVYDPKFSIEANLGRIECWKEFLDDLGGKNVAHHKVDFSQNNPNIGEQLSEWMDFWSPGNHDDRTVAIIF